MSAIRITQDQWNVLGKRALESRKKRFCDKERAAIERFLSLCAWDVEDLAEDLNQQAAQEKNARMFFRNLSDLEADEVEEGIQRIESEREYVDGEAEGAEFEP